MEKQGFRELATVATANYKDRNFCTVVALAATLDWTFGKAYRWMAKHGGRKHGHGMFEVNWAPAIASAAVTVGKRFKSVDDHLLQNVYGFKSMTLKRFCKENPKGTYYLKVRGHAIAVVDGVAIDWTADTAGRRKIISCYKLVEESVV